MNNEKIDEIKNKIKKLKEKKELLLAQAKKDDVFQHAYKIYLNSVYGFTGTQYSPVFSTDLAEAVTTTGKATTKEMVRFTNNALVKVDNGKTGLTQYVVAGDTDSCLGSTKINNKTIEKLFNENLNNGYTKLRKDVDIVFPKNEYCYSINGLTNIKNISRHLVSKNAWKITIDGVDTVITEDHSIMVMRDGKIIECKINKLHDGDFLIKRKHC